MAIEFLKTEPAFLTIALAKTTTTERSAIRVGLFASYDDTVRSDKQADRNPDLISSTTAPVVAVGRNIPDQFDWRSFVTQSSVERGLATVEQASLILAIY